MNKAAGDSVKREELESLIATADPDRFSPATLKSIAQNINASWTQAGYLQGWSGKSGQSPA